MLRPRFVDAIAGQAVPRGWLAIISLATFKPIGDAYGIPAVERSGDYLGQLISRTAPADAITGGLTWTRFAGFLPGATLDDIAGFVRSLRSATVEDDLEIFPGVWVEIRVAVGVLEVTAGELGPDVIETATRLAEQDMSRYPVEWGLARRK